MNIIREPFISNIIFLSNLEQWGDGRSGMECSNLVSKEFWIMNSSKNGKDVMNFQKQIVSQPYPGRSQGITISFCNGDENVL